MDLIVLNNCPGKNNDNDILQLLPNLVCLVYKNTAVLLLNVLKSIHTMKSICSMEELFENVIHSK